jgi:hypothetical protein
VSPPASASATVSAPPVEPAPDYKPPAAPDPSAPVVTRRPY